MPGRWCVAGPDARHRLPTDYGSLFPPEPRRRIQDKRGRSLYAGSIPAGASTFHAGFAYHKRKREIEERGIGDRLDRGDDADADRLALLDRLGDRVPELNLDQHEVGLTTLPEGGEALLVDGGGIEGGNGIYFANYGDDVLAVGSLAPAFPVDGCIVIRPDKSRSSPTSCPIRWRSPTRIHRAGKRSYLAD